jgi:gliding motility-associated-like protein
MPSDAVLCSMSETFTAAFTGGLILWEAPAGVTIAQPVSGTTLISADVPGTYVISATVNDDGCSTDGFFNVTFNYPPGSSTLVEHASCFGICDGRVSVENENTSPLTITVDGRTVTGQPASIDSLCAGNYSLQIEFSAACSSTESITINEPSPISASFEPVSLILPFANPVVTLTSTSENADSLYWQVIGLDSMNYTDSIWELVFPQEPGLYDVQLMVFDSAGCSDMFSAPFEVRDDFRFFLPTGFTPNDDGLNDFLVPSFTYEPTIYHMQIFNRYGDVVFDSKDFREVWLGDHRDKGYYVPNGIYSYIVTTRGVERDLKTYKGTITIMR